MLKSLTHKVKTSFNKNTKIGDTKSHADENLVPIASTKNSAKKSTKKPQGSKRNEQTITTSVPDEPGIIVQLASRAVDSRLEFELAAQAMRALVLDRDGCVPKELAAAIYFDGEGEQLRYAMSEPEIERVLYDM